MSWQHYLGDQTRIINPKSIPAYILLSFRVCNDHFLVKIKPIYFDFSS